jgi:quinol monooxygenase YgiN
MFGTIAQVKVAPGEEAAFREVWEAWTEARGMETGVMSAQLFKLERELGAYCVVGVFRDRASYLTNAADPITDEWFRKLRATLAEDPIWHDGEVIDAKVFSGI